MHALVLDQVRPHPERFPTQGARVRLLPRVHPLMLGQVHTLIVAFPTLVAPERFLPGVYPLMLDEMCALNKALPAFITFMGSLSSGGLLVGVGDFAEIQPL